jgi:hypothetical protein
MVQEEGPMLTTVKAEIDVGGNVRLLEPLEVSKTTRAIVTLLDDNGNGDKAGNAKGVLDFLRQNRLPEGSRPTSEEIDDQIEEARNSWD